ncbi:MAG: hypothetical protein ACREJM_07450 [Candidatus Saccharimonadales bacterium]
MTQLQWTLPGLGLAVMSLTLAGLPAFLRQRLVSGLRSWPALQGTRPELPAETERQRFVAGFLVWPALQGFRLEMFAKTERQRLVSGFLVWPALQDFSDEAASAEILSQRSVWLLRY